MTAEQAIYHHWYFVRLSLKWVDAPAVDRHADEPPRFDRSLNQELAGRNLFDDAFSGHRRTSSSTLELASDSEGGSPSISCVLNPETVKPHKLSAPWRCISEKA